MASVVVVSKQGAHGQSNGGGGAGSNSVAISEFPAKVQALLQEVDSTGDGLLQVDELHQIFDAYRNLVAQQREKSLDIAHMPKEFQQICQPFDVNGNGKVEAFELAHAADLYTKEKAKSRSYLRVVMLLGLLLVVLLGCSMALTFAVVELSKESKVGEDGVMTMAGDSSKVVKVKSADSFVNQKGEMRNKDGKEITMPSKTTNVALRYGCPTGLFTRMKEISVTEPSFTAMAKVVGVYKTSLELVVSTDLFKVRVRKDGNTLIEPLEDDLIRPTEMLPELPAEGSGFRRRLQGTDRSLLQATSGVGVSLTDELGSTAGDNGEDPGSSGVYKYVTIHENSKCKSAHMLVDNSFTGDADACIAKVLEGIGNGSCAAEPTVFGFRTTGEDSNSGCYCVAPYEDCMAEVMTQRQVMMIDADGKAWPRGTEGVENPTYEWRTVGEQGWNVYFLDSPLTGNQTRVFDEWAADNNLAVTLNTPIPEDPRIELVATGKACMNVKSLVRPSQSQSEFITVDECMRLAFEDPDCLAHGPTIQFHDYTNADAKPKYESVGISQKDFAMWDCSCSYQCDYDTVEQFSEQLCDDNLSFEELYRRGGDFSCGQYTSLFVTRGNKRCRGDVYGLNPPNDDTYPFILRRPKREQVKAFIETGTYYKNDINAYVYGDNGSLLGLKGSQGTFGYIDRMDVYVFPRENSLWGTLFRPPIFVPQGHCLDPRFQFNMTEEDLEKNAESGLGNTNIYTWKPAVPPDPCTLVNVGRGNVDGSGFAQVQIPVGGYVCPTTIDSTRGAFDEDVFHLVQFQEQSVVSSASITPDVSYVAAFKSDGARSWDYDLQFSCCIPPPTARASTDSSPQQITVVVGSNVESHEWMEVQIQPGYTCPRLLNKDNWVGGYTLDYEFVVKQIGTTLHIKNPRGCNYRWEGMYLMFPCERDDGVAPTTAPAPQPAFSPCSTISAGKLEAPVPGVMGDHIMLGACTGGLAKWSTYTENVPLCQSVALEKNAAYFSYNLQTQRCKVYNTCTGSDDQPYYTYRLGNMLYEYQHLGKFQRPCEEGTVVGGEASGYSLDECKAACNAHDECNTFTHNAASGGCSLKRLEDSCNHGGICAVSEEDYDGYEQYMTWGGCHKKIFTASVGSEQICPSVVDSRNWVVPEHQLDETMMDHTFALTRIGDVDGEQAYLVERTDSSGASGWVYDLGIECCMPLQCKNVWVGSSEDHRPHEGQRVHVDAGYTCPATVTKHNWGGGATWNDKFHIIQKAKGAGSAPQYSEGSELVAMRSDAPGAGWGMKLEFQCCQQYDCVKVPVGPNDGSTPSLTWTVPEGYVCPEKVTKTNWMGGWPYDDAFTVVQDGESVRVMRDTCHTTEWGIELEFECCKPVAHRYTTCTCSTPGARVYTCSDNTVGYCKTDQECYATDPFIKGDLANGCR